MQDSFSCASVLSHQDQDYHYMSLPKAEASGCSDIHQLPFCLKVLLENVLRHEDGSQVTQSTIQAFSQWVQDKRSDVSIAFHPARVLMQDFTGVPAVVDLATMREQFIQLGGDGKKVNPCIPVDLVIDHSVQVDAFASPDALAINVGKEVERNHERYTFLKWAQNAFDGLRVVPPSMGICHQVNLEYLAQCVWQKQEGDKTWIYPDALVGTDSHNTMINGLGVLGWGVGGIEAEACMMGQSISMILPEVIGFELKGELPQGIHATDLVLTICSMLREYGVVGKFVEFFGEGLHSLTLADRATISNMSPEFGATSAIFPVDDETLKYLANTNRSEEQVALVKSYLQAQGMWTPDYQHETVYTDVLSLDLSTVALTVSGPKRPQDKVLVKDLHDEVKTHIPQDESFGQGLNHGDVVIAAITSCTNTSNPFVMCAAGIMAKKAHALGIAPKPWVKTSLAPGSKVVTDYLHKAGLLPHLEAIGFHVVGYGCTTCIGNSGPLPEEVSKQIEANDLKVASVLSGNRNFEGRIHPLVKHSWLASPPLVVAYALAGTTCLNLEEDIIAVTEEGKEVRLHDLWPSNQEVLDAMHAVNQDMFAKAYGTIFEGDEAWRGLEVDASGETYAWQPQSTYVKHPPFLASMQKEPSSLNDISAGRILAVLGDSVTTDHISPAGAIAENVPAGQYLKQQGVGVEDFNSYGSRRGNHEIMMRGTFANIRIRNQMTPEHEGGWSRHVNSETAAPLYDVAMQYQSENTPLFIFAGKEYGTGSSRDWAAKGTNLLGIKAVVAESFERIHRSNLVGMGVLPLQLMHDTCQSLGLDGTEEVSLENLTSNLSPRGELNIRLKRKDGRHETIKVLVRLDTDREYDYYCHGGILPYALRAMLVD